MNDYKDRLQRAVRTIEKLKQELNRRIDDHEPISIVGMGCRFPGDIDGPERFWEALLAGEHMVTTDAPAERWCDWFESSSIARGHASAPGGFVENMAMFDPQFFGISPREAGSIDPQQRFVLETTWEALEHAGVPPHTLGGTRTGVFIGGAYSGYMAGLNTTGVGLRGVSGNSNCFIAGRLSFCLGLQGPSIAIETACSSSLVAVHLAIQSLRQHECDLALCGGVNLMTISFGHTVLEQGGMLSKEGRCKAFDADADGYVRGEGCGILVLKRSADVRPRDRVIAVLRGSAVNQDGASGGITVPNRRAQEDVIRAALRDADVDPESVGYIEAHGTGTRLGDPIEARALAHVYCRERDQHRPLRIGAVKTNIGHLEAAAGVAGLMKAALHGPARRRSADVASPPIESGGRLGPACMVHPGRGGALDRRCAHRGSQ